MALYLPEGREGKEGEKKLLLLIELKAPKGRRKKKKSAPIVQGGPRSVRVRPRLGLPPGELQSAPSGEGCGRRLLPTRGVAPHPAAYFAKDASPPVGAV